MKESEKIVSRASYTRALLRGPLFQTGKAKRRGLRRPKRKPTPPRCARQPLPREGARVDIPSFHRKEVPRRGGGWMGGSGMKKIGGDRLKCVVYESTRAPLRGPPSPLGKATIRECRFSRIVRANTRICGKKNNDGQSLPRVGKVASGASRIGFWRDEKERRRSSQVRRLREYPSAARGPLSQIGKAKRRGLRRPKRKPTPPRCARQCTCQQKLDTKLKKLGIKIEYLYKIQ